MTNAKKSTKKPAKKVPVYMPSIAQTRLLLKFMKEHNIEMPSVETALREGLRRASAKKK